MEKLTHQFTGKVEWGRGGGVDNNSLDKLHGEIDTPIFTGQVERGIDTNSIHWTFWGGGRQTNLKFEWGNRHTDSLEKLNGKNTENSHTKSHKLTDTIKLLDKYDFDYRMSFFQNKVLIEEYF
jgi:hypothetical protein